MEANGILQVGSAVSQMKANILPANRELILQTRQQDYPKQNVPSELTSWENTVDRNTDLLPPQNYGWEASWVPVKHQPCPHCTSPGNCTGNLNRERKGELNVLSSTTSLFLQSVSITYYGERNTDRRARHKRSAMEMHLRSHNIFNLKAAAN